MEELLNTPHQRREISAPTKSTILCYISEDDHRVAQCLIPGRTMYFYLYLNGPSTVKHLHFRTLHNEPDPQDQFEN